MQVVQVQPRDSLLHYVHVSAKDTILQWSFTTNRKTIGFGLYRRLGQGRLPSSSDIIVQQRQWSMPPSSGSSDRLTTDSGSESRSQRPRSKSAAAIKLNGKQDIVELIPIEIYDSSKTKIEGSYTVKTPGNYILVFDNTFSRNTAKVVSFSVALLTDRVESEPAPRQEILSGWLWKRKRKMMQGWAKRWFHLSPAGVLSYSTSPTSVTRGSIQILAATISSAPQQRIIHIDSGTMIYHLKTHTVDQYDVWLSTLRSFRPSTTPSVPNLANTLPSSTVPPLPPRPDTPVSPSAESPSNRLSATNLKSGPALPASLESSVACYMETVDQFIHLTLELWPDYTITDPRVSSLLPILKEQQEHLRAALSLGPSPPHTLANYLSLPKTGQNIPYAPSYHPSNFSEQFFDAEDDLLLSPDEDYAGDVYDDAETDPEDEEEDEEDEAHPAGDTATETPHIESHDDWMALVESTVCKRRTTLPAPAATDGFASALTVFRKNLGKDLSTISMPVSMNEPINFLQRACEELEYSELLEKAAELSDSTERLLHVAAFAVSGYASSQYRTGRKPFNPMMSETYENVRPDKRFRFIAEKVCHNPLIIAAHAESKSFKHWQCVKIKSKFWGKSMEFINQGIFHVTLTGHDDHYTYSKPSSWLRNMLAGEKYLEHVGELRVTNQTSGEYAIVSFKEGKGGSFFSAPKHRNDVVITVHDKDGQRRRRAVGKWSEKLAEEVNLNPKQLSVIWTAQPPNIANYNDYYGFTRFCVELNEITDIERDALPKTDTRLRPDQRLYEQGLVEKADAEKQRIENKQRERRKALAQAGIEWKPRWFVLAQDPYADPDLVSTDEQSASYSWQYDGQYWPARESKQWPEDLFDLW